MTQEIRQAEEKNRDYRSYHRTQMQREMVLQRLREKGCRITRQRLLLLNIILEEECASCKEIYYRAIEEDNRIGSATVYRMVNTLEEIGAISRKNMYKIACAADCGVEDACVVEFENDTVCALSGKNWFTVVQAGLAACGYLQDRKIKSVTVKKCDGDCAC